MPKRKVHKRDIIGAAYRLFTARGFARTSMSDIASACGLLKGSIYHYFASKEDLIEAVLQSSLAYKSLGLIPIAYNEDIPPRERMERFFKSIDGQALMDLQGNLMLAAVLELGAEERYKPHLVRFYDAWTQALMRILPAAPGQEPTRQQIRKMLEELQGSIILSLVYENPKYLEQCSSSLIKRSFDK